MNEIKEHPWYLQNLPNYLKEISNNSSRRKDEEIDMEIV